MITPHEIWDLVAYLIFAVIAGVMGISLLFIPFNMWDEHLNERQREKNSLDCPYKRY